MDPTKLTTTLRIQWATDEGMVGHRHEWTVPSRYGWLLIFSLVGSVVIEIVNSKVRKNA